MSGAFLQSNLWTLFKGSFELEPYSFHFEGKLVNAYLRRFFKFFSLVYVPYAPIEQERLEEVSAYLKPMLPKSCLFIRWDLPWYVKEEGEWPDAPESFHRATMDVQPPSSVILNISRPLEDIRRGFKDRARRNIKIAEKKGVVITDFTAPCRSISVQMLFSVFREKGGVKQRACRCQVYDQPAVTYDPLCQTKI